MSVFICLQCGTRRNHVVGAEHHENANKGHEMAEIEAGQPLHPEVVAVLAAAEAKRHLPDTESSTPAVVASFRETFAAGFLRATETLPLSPTVVGGDVPQAQLGALLRWVDQHRAGAGFDCVQARDIAEILGATTRSAGGER